jgi:hypothetical protein
MVASSHASASSAFIRSIAIAGSGRASASDSRIGLPETFSKFCSRYPRRVSVAASAGSASVETSACTGVPRSWNIRSILASRSSGGTPSKPTPIILFIGEEGPA